MFLNEPGRTNYDLNFNLFGFPVRIHPAFFVLPVLFGAQTGSGPKILVFAIIFFVSILIHELGHAIAMRYFGKSARVVLYMMGGLAIPDSGNPWSTPTRFTSQQQILVSFAGPLAGFVLAVVFALVTMALKGTVSFEFVGIFPLFFSNFDESNIANNEYLIFFLQYGLLINVYLNILNLAPVFPLDGGQIAREIFQQKNTHNGLRYSLMLSIAVSIAIAVYGFSIREQFLALFFAFMAWNNWQMLQQQNGGYGGGGKPW